MKSIENACQCACGVYDFELRINRDGPVGLLTCPAGHHSLLLDSREYWADLLQDGRPKMSRCGCGGKLFRVYLEYELRQGGDVRTIHIKPICSNCDRPQTVVSIDIKYSPTDELISKPLDAIQEPWLQPKRREITSFWQAVDAEKFASYLVQSLGARVFSRNRALVFLETTLTKIEFYPELKHDLLFTNIEGVTVPPGPEPQRSAPFLRLNQPFHMVYSKPENVRSLGNIRLLHYIKFSHQVVQQGALEDQPARFQNFCRHVCEWLSQHYVSIRGKNTADNPDEYLKVKKDRGQV